jgi:hypothetical protein
MRGREDGASISTFPDRLPFRERQLASCRFLRAMPAPSLRGGARSLPRNKIALDKQVPAPQFNHEFFVGRRSRDGPD